jgi:hypothetical protein
MDARKAEFNTLVATPLVSCIDKLHNFASAVAVAREEVRRVPGMHPSERIQKFSLMQRQEFASARSQLQIAIAAAAKYQQTSPRTGMAVRTVWTLYWTLSILCVARTRQRTDLPQPLREC